MEKSFRKKFIITTDQKLFQLSFEDDSQDIYYCDETKEKLNYDELKPRVLLETDNIDLILQYCANIQK